MKTKRLLAVMIVVLSVQTQAFAWSGPGHAAVAAMAYRELAADPTLRANLTDLLKSHPKFSTWKKEYEAAKQSFPASLDFGMFLFIRASTWPDEIRRTKNTKLKPFDHPGWHFVDYPLEPPEFETGPRPDPEDDVLFGIQQSRETLADENADLVQRAASLSWLIHLVGDIHQPLHCATLMSSAFPAPEGDQGGNKFLFFQNADHQSRKLKTKLHSYWDSRLGAGTPPDPEQALQDAKMLQARHSRTALSELNAGDDVEQWSFESRDAASTDVYRFRDKMLKQKAVLPKGYVTNSHNVARRRLALAGFRLADDLKLVAF